MICVKCGSYMPNYAKKCRICGREIPPDQGVLESIQSRLLQVLAGVGIFLWGMFGAVMVLVSVMFGEMGVVVQPVGMTLLFSLLLVTQKNRQGPDFVKKLLVVAGLYYVVWGLSVNNIPEFLRAIPGSDFIPLWWLFAAAVCAAAVFLQLMLAKKAAAENREQLERLSFTDGDLMILQNYN